MPVSPSATQVLPSGDSAHPTTAIAGTRDVPTQTFATVDPQTEQGGEPDQPGEPAAMQPQDAGHPKRRSRKALIIVVVLLFVIASVGGGISWWHFLGPGSYWSVPQPDDVSCTEGKACSIAGANWSKYRSTLNVSGIPFTEQQRYDDTIAEGDIISATPGNVGDRISKRSNDAMTVVVSKGVRTATMPSDILDPSSANGKDVLGALKTAGFDNVAHDESQDVYSETLPAGAAISIDGADPGATVKHNTQITVVLSKGPMPVEMPDIVGKTKDEMQSAFDELKLTANVTEQYDDKIAAGQVISASKNAGDQLHWGDAVDVVVSKGPETITLENYVGQKASTAKAALEKLGFTVTVKSQITLDSSKDKLVASQDPTGGTVVRLRDENGKANAVTLTMYSSLL